MCRSLYFLSFLLLACNAQARIVKLVITKTEPYQNGRVFGAAGTYERVFGRAYGEVDPTTAQNRIIQDLQLAPKNARGRVEYVSEFVLLRPVDSGKSNGLLFLSLPNRGNVFGADSTLLKRGYVYLWCAWQGDVLPGEGYAGPRVTMQVPVATDNGREITGQLRQEYQVNSPTKTLPLSSGAFTNNTHHVYETVSLDNTGLALTRRMHEADPRESVPNSDWAFSDCTNAPFPGKPSTIHISLRDGFDPNYIYELVYTAKNPLVLGLGFAAIRDMASFLRHQTTDEAGNRNPVLAPNTNTIPIRASILQGVSQCSNFCRTFLQLGFNQDEDGGRVFDGINAHIGTRRISLNVRFGRPGGGGMQREDHLFAANEPPFTWSIEREPVSGLTGGMMQACGPLGNCPKIMQTVGSTEYWQSRVSLTTANGRGKKDLTIPDNVRVYFLTGTQHSPMSVLDPLSGFMTNPNPMTPTHRALLIHLEQWVLMGKEPPASQHPTIRSKTLVRPDQKSTGWPTIPGVPYSGLLNSVPLLDHGPSYDPLYMTGVLTITPPNVVKEHPYRVLVPKVDADGNEVSGIRSVSIRVPLGTHTGWALRRAGYGEGDLASLNGMFIPFRKTKTERLAANDPRPSLEERYGTHENYMNAVRQAADDLVREGFLLPDDAAWEVSRAEKNTVLK